MKCQIQEGVTSRVEENQNMKRDAGIFNCLLKKKKTEEKFVLC